MLQRRKKERKEGMKEGMNEGRRVEDERKKPKRQPQLNGCSFPLTSNEISPPLNLLDSPPSPSSSSSPPSLASTAANFRAVRRPPFSAPNREGDPLRFLKRWLMPSFFPSTRTRLSFRYSTRGWKEMKYSWLGWAQYQTSLVMGSTLEKMGKWVTASTRSKAYSLRRTTIRS